MLPLLWRAGSDFNASQAEMMSRLIKQLQMQPLLAFVAAFVDGEDGQPSSWTETQVTVLQGAISRRPELDSATLLGLLQQADANVDMLRKSLKFSNLMFTLVKSYGAELLPHLLLARRTIEKLDTFLKKSALSVLERLEKSE